MEYTLDWTKPYPDLIWAGYSQLGLYLGLNRPRPDYTRYIMAWANLYLGVYYGLRGYDLA